MNRLVLWAGLLAGSLPALANAEGFYVSAFGGVGFLSDADNVNPNPEPLPIDIESRNDTGWVAGGTLGYAFANGFRAEGEVSYRRNRVDQLRVSSDGGLGPIFGVPSLNGATLETDGHATALAFMANAWYDFKTGTAWTPYIGGGVGAARVALEEVEVSGFELVDSKDVVFAYQLGAGIAYAVTPRFKLTLDYRFFDTPGDPGLVDFGDVAFDTEYRHHSILFGARLGF